MRTSKQKYGLALLGVMTLGVLFSKTLSTIPVDAKSGTIVVFNANWCASCREVIPVVSEIATQNNLSLTQIDVDAQTAPKQAQTLGLSVPNDGPPQVYYVDRGRSTLLYNGKGYKFGYSDAMRATILQNLQQILP